MLPDFGWSELLVIGIVLIVIVGPKDLPKMLRTFGKTTSSLRKMAGDFRRQFDEALKEAELDDVRELASDMKGLDPRGHIKEALNPLGKIGEDISADLKRAAKDIDKATKPPSAAESALAASGEKMRAAQAKANKSAAGTKTARPKAAGAKSKAPAKTAATAKAATTAGRKPKAPAKGSAEAKPTATKAPATKAAAAKTTGKTTSAKPASSKTAGKPAAAGTGTRTAKPKAKPAATKTAARKTTAAKSSGDKS